MHVWNIGVLGILKCERVTQTFRDSQDSIIPILHPMEQPFWKETLSHFYEFHLESTSSKYNEELHVHYVRGRYQLTTKNAIYSFGDLYSNFRRAFERINLDNYAIQNVLVLGFGLGSIPQMLEQKFNKSYHYTAVEIDEKIIYLANKYVTSSLASTIEFVCADAYDYVQSCEHQFDMIAIDLFIDDEIPIQFETTTFFEKVKTLLTPDGLLLFNRLAATREDRAISKGFYFSTFKPIFPNGIYLDVGGNWMFLNIDLLEVGSRQSKI